MFSHEIENWLSNKNYSITSKEYIWLTKESGSSQIDHIKYEPYSNVFHIWTTDGYEWNVTVNLYED